MTALCNGKSRTLGSTKGAPDVGAFGALYAPMQSAGLYRVPVSINHSGYKSGDMVGTGSRCSPIASAL